MSLLLRIIVYESTVCQNGSPVVRAQCFPCQGPRFNPWGTKILQATLHSQKIEKCSQIKCFCQRLGVYK